MKLKRLIILVFIFIVVAVILFFGAKSLSNYFLERKISSMNNESIESRYAQVVTKETDVNKLTAQGATLMQGNQISSALINLKRATTVDPNFKEPWFWLGFAELRNNQPQEALEALNKAAELDPIDPRIYKMLSIGYEQIKDDTASEKATEKYEFLVKK